MTRRSGVTAKPPPKPKKPPGGWLPWIADHSKKLLIGVVGALSLGALFYFYDNVQNFARSKLGSLTTAVQDRMKGCESPGLIVGLAAVICLIGVLGLVAVHFYHLSTHEGMHLSGVECQELNQQLESLLDIDHTIVRRLAASNAEIDSKIRYDSALVMLKAILGQIMSAYFPDNVIAIVPFVPSRDGAYLYPLAGADWRAGGGSLPSDVLDRIRFELNSPAEDAPIGVAVRAFRTREVQHCNIFDGKVKPAASHADYIDLDVILEERQFKSFSAYPILDRDTDRTPRADRGVISVEFRSHLDPNDTKDEEISSSLALCESRLAFVLEMIAKLDRRGA